MLVVGPDVPAAMRPFAISVVEAIRALQAPGAPTLLFSCARAELPAPKAWTNCVVRVADLNIIAVSDGLAWIRQDTGAVI